MRKESGKSSSWLWVLCVFSIFHPNMGSNLCYFPLKSVILFFWNPSTSQLIHNGVRLFLKKIVLFMILQRFMIDFHKGNFKSEQLFFFVYEHTLSPRLSADQSLVVLQSNLALRNCLIRNKLVLRNHFLWPICYLLHMDKELLALRNHFRVTKKFLIAKFDCSWK